MHVTCHFSDHAHPARKRTPSEPNSSQDLDDTQPSARELLRPTTTTTGKIEVRLSSSCHNPVQNWKNRCFAESLALRPPVEDVEVTWFQGTGSGLILHA